MIWITLINEPINGSYSFLMQFARRNSDRNLTIFLQLFVKGLPQLITVILAWPESYEVGLNFGL